MLPLTRPYNTPGELLCTPLVDFMLSFKNRRHNYYIADNKSHNLTDIYFCIIYQTFSNIETVTMVQC